MSGARRDSNNGTRGGHGKSAGGQDSNAHPPGGGAS